MENIIATVYKIPITVVSNNDLASEKVDIFTCFVRRVIFLRGNFGGKRAAFGV